MRLLLSLLALVALGSALRCYTHPDVISVRNRKVLNFPEAISECKADAICGVLKLSTTSRRMCTPNCLVRNGCKGTLCCCDTDLCNKDIQAMRRDRREAPEAPTNTSLEQADTSFNVSELSEAAETFAPVSEGLEFSLNASVVLEDLKDIGNGSVEAPSKHVVDPLPEAQNASEPEKALPEVVVPEVVEASLNVSEFRAEKPENASTATEEVYLALSNSSKTPAESKALQSINNQTTDSGIGPAFNGTDDATTSGTELDVAPEVVTKVSWMKESNTSVEVTREPWMKESNISVEVTREPWMKESNTSVEVTREPWMKESNTSVEVTREPWMESNTSVTSEVAQSPNNVSAASTEGDAEVDATTVDHGFNGFATTEANETATDVQKTLPAALLNNTEMHESNKTLGSTTRTWIDYDPPKALRVNVSDDEVQTTTKAPEVTEANTTTEAVEVDAEKIVTTMVSNLSEVIGGLVVVVELPPSAKNETTFNTGNVTKAEAEITTEDPAYVVDSSTVKDFLSSESEADPMHKTGEGSEPSAATGTGGVALFFAALLTLILK